MKFLKSIIFPAALLLLASCSKDNTLVSFDENRFVNTFAKDMFTHTYLWADEVSNKVAAWDMTGNPVENVAGSRMKDSQGNLIDRWTSLMRDSKAFLSSVSSTKLSFGLDYKIYLKASSDSEFVLVVLYVSPGGPAAQAGLRRGDVIERVNGLPVTRSNYLSLLKNIDTPREPCTFTMLKSGHEINLSPREFHESPVLLKKIFHKGTDKIGYMVFNSFNRDADSDLIEAGRFFRENGVKELILDLRYNSGGYLMTERILASMLVPKQAVLAGELYSSNVFNKHVTEAIGDKSKLETRLSFDFEYEIEGVKHKFSTADANMGISKLYILTGPRTASASESLICCVSAFLPVEIIGVRTVGKFCGGQLFKGRDWYESNNTRSKRVYHDSSMGDWCIYMMTAMWTDKSGGNSAYPSGISPDIELKEFPLDRIPLGDAREVLLSRALQRAGFGGTIRPSGKYAKSSGRESSYNIYYDGEIKPLRALRIE